MTPQHTPGRLIEDGRELLPCPSCGGDAEFERLGSARQSTIISCKDCGARLETGEIWSAGDSWSHRANLSTETRSITPPATSPAVIGGASISNEAIEAAAPDWPTKLATAICGRFRNLPEDEADELHGIIQEEVQTALPFLTPQWRPISEAPKDGTQILLLIGEDVSVGQYDNDHFAKRPRPFWNYERFSHRISFCRARQPTHFLPLPSPPEDER